MLADDLLGRLIDRLQALRRFESALVVVAADHGASYWPGESRRLLYGHTHPEDILRVPVFIKSPGQTTASVVDRKLSTVDLLPTISDLLYVEIPLPVDGVSSFDDAAEDRAVLSSTTKAGVRL